MPGQNLKSLPDNRAVILANVTCVYCGQEMADEDRTKEHVVGRRFIPKGKLDGNWNLIVQACRTCNQLKSTLEDDISAISMQPDLYGRYGHDDDEAAADGQRKARRAVSRRTGKRVADSTESMTLTMPLAQGVEAKFSFVGPAQADSNRVFMLARMQLMAFFYFVTYDKETNRGRFWREGFYPIMELRRSDWGHPVQRAFMAAVVDWEPRVLAVSADGFYKVVIRRHPAADCWSWALEWNQSMRIIGFFGDRAAAETIAGEFPKIKPTVLSQGDGQTLAFREETPLLDDEDTLFIWSGDFEGGGGSDNKLNNPGSR